MASARPSSARPLPPHNATNQTVHTRHAVLTALAAEVVERLDVGVEVVAPVRVGRVLLVGPLLGRGEALALVRVQLRLALVVHAVEAHDRLEEGGEGHVGLRVARGLEQGGENVAEDVLKVVDLARALVHRVEARDLDEPADLVRGEAVRVEPARELVPLRRLASVDRDAPLHELVLGRVQVRHDLLRHLRQVPPRDQVVRLQEDLAQPALVLGVVGCVGGGQGWVGGAERKPFTRRRARAPGRRGCT